MLGAVLTLIDKLSKISTTQGSLHTELRPSPELKKILPAQGILVDELGPPEGLEKV